MSIITPASQASTRHNCQSTVLDRCVKKDDFFNVAEIRYSLGANIQFELVDRHMGACCTKGRTVGWASSCETNPAELAETFRRADEVDDD